MAKFTKGMKRPAGAGRKPGSRNKVTRAVKEVYAAAFHDLQDDPRRNLVAWAKKNAGNLREFYKISARFIPIEAAIAPSPTVDPNNLQDIARRLAVVLRRARDELRAQDAANVLRLPEKVVSE